MSGGVRAAARPQPASVLVRPLASPDEYRACQGVQRRAFGIHEDGYVVPVATLAAVQKVGGLVLGAFLPDGTLVGFTFAFLGRLDGQLLLYSQIAAVDPAYQGLGLGATLKEAQRAWAREQGLPAVAWAFDPLQARNASFNLAKLGAVARRYEVNLYGPRSDELNAGLDTDRLLVVWPVDAKPPGPPPAQRGPDLVHSEPLASGLRRPVSVELPLAAPLVEIEIPADLALVRAHDPALARQWQTAVRTAFLAAFGAGYVATNVRRAEAPTGQRVWYLLEQRPTPGREP